MVALPSKFVEYLKMEDTFTLPYETYTWGEIYSIITKSLIGLCTSMKIQKSVSKTSYLPDQKSVCEQYGLYNTNPSLQTRKRCKEYKKERNKKPPGRYKFVPNIHYFRPQDIKMKTHKHEAKQQIK
jgi:hypothetical protein